MSALLALWSRGGAPLEPGLESRMAAAMAHRGIDGRDAWRADDGAMAAAHLHFWTTPEEVGERQPLAEGGRVLVWDGRLDDREGLAARLDIPPSELRGLSDARLVLRAHRRFGEALPEALVGPFAFVLLEPGAGRLLAARDAAGSRSLCYRLQRDRILLATEPCAILAHPGVDDGLDDVWLACHLALRHAADGRTIFRAVRELRSGEAMLASPEGERIWRFRELGTAPRLRYPRDEDYAEAFLEHLGRAVQRRMRAPAPVDVLMSGGLDSTPVAALAAEARGARPGAAALRTFSYVFDDYPDSDERVYIRAMAERWGLDARTVLADEAVPLRGMAGWPRNPNAPEGNMFRNLMELIFAEVQRAEGRVLLCGYGGDRLYDGEAYWLADLIADGRIREGARELGKHLRGAGPRRVLRSETTRALLRAALAPLGWRGRPPRRPAWLRPERWPAVAAQPDWPPEAAALRRPGPLRALVGAEPSSLAIAAPFGPARYGLELRDPFRDLDLISFVLRLPAYFLYHRATAKRIVRLALRGLLPEPVRTRGEKTRYEAFLAKGFAEARLSVTDTFEGSDAIGRRFLLPEPIRAASSGGSKMDRSETLVLWHAVALTQWNRSRSSAEGAEADRSALSGKRSRP